MHMLESQKKANEKWLKANYEQIAFRAPKGTKEEIKAAAAAHGMSMAAFIQAACKEKAGLSGERDHEKPSVNVLKAY